MKKKVCDTVFLSIEGNTYLLTKSTGGDNAILERYPIVDGCVQEGSVVVKGKRSCRMAGAIIYKDGKTIRVAQDCLMGYGLALNFYEITCCNQETYCETDLARIDIENMPSKQRKKYVGLHTYNFNESYEVIDLKNKNRFRFGNLINIGYRIFRGMVK